MERGYIPLLLLCLPVRPPCRGSGLLRIVLKVLNSRASASAAPVRGELRLISTRSPAATLPSENLWRERPLFTSPTFCEGGRVAF